MKFHQTMQPAPYGLYISTRPFDVRFVGADGETLDGLPGASYRRVPTLLALLLAPMLGGAFVIAFPILVIVAAVVGIARVAVREVRKAAGEHAWLASPRWEPSTSYLTKGEKKGDVEEVPTELADLRDEVGERRADEN